MAGFYRTTLGSVVLQQRNIALNARQRRLLLLIDHEDFQTLNQDFKSRIATPELIEQLIELRLIAKEDEPYQSIQRPSTRQTQEQDSIILKRTEAATRTPSTATHVSPSPIPPIEAVIKDQISTETTPVIQCIETSSIAFSKNYSSIDTNHSSTLQTTDSPQTEKLTFQDIQQLMIDTLNQYCRLMAKPLIQKIEQSHTPQQLKMCQIQWITNLQESRIPPHELTHRLHTINNSMQALQQ